MENQSLDFLQYHPSVDNLIGRRFEKLIVHNFIRINERNLAVWNCICDCGGQRMTTGESLKRKYAKSCGCLQNGRIKGNKHHLWRGHGEIHQWTFNKIKHSAIKRKINFDLTIQQIWDLFLKQERKCAISGVDIEFCKATTKNQRTEGTASLDRIDSEGHYTIDNVWWTHKKINEMKNISSTQELVNWCQQVCQYQNSKNLRD